MRQSSTSSQDSIKIHSGVHNGVAPKDMISPTPLSTSVQSNKPPSLHTPETSNISSANGNTASEESLATAVASQVENLSSLPSGKVNSAPSQNGTELASGEPAMSVISAATSSEDLAAEDFKDAIDADIPTFFTTMDAK